MKFNDQPYTRRITVLAQDPAVTDHKGCPVFTSINIPNERWAAGPKGARFHVIDYDAALDKFIAPSNTPLLDMAKPVADLIKSGTGTAAAKKSAAKALLADPHFHAQNVYGLAASTLLTFERALGRHVHWGLDSGAHLMKIAPHAFNDMNAFYSRRDEMLAFGYFSDPLAAGKFVFTALSADIVVHETTHAILDGLRTEFMRPSSIDQAAFHEGFADIVALLSAFKSKELINLALGGSQTDKTISKEAITPPVLRQTFLLGLAKQFGKALSALFGGADNNALRRSAEILPDAELYTREKENAEVHDFGEVLVAPVINTFLEIWCARVAPLDPVSSGRIDRARAIKEGCKAADHLLGMCIRALDYLPPVNMTYHNYLRAILTADKETAVDDNKYHYRELLRASFHAYGIKKNRPGDNDMWRAPQNADDICYGYSGHSEMQWDKESVYRFIWENSEILELHDDAFTKIVSVRPVKRRAPDGTIVKETVVEYLQILHVFASELGKHGTEEIEPPADMPSTKLVKLYGGGTLIFNDYGGLKYHIGTGVTSGKQTERLSSLWKLGFYHRAHKKARRFARLHNDRAKGQAVRRSKEQWS